MDHLYFDPRKKCIFTTNNFFFFFRIFSWTFFEIVFVKKIVLKHILYKYMYSNILQDWLSVMRMRRHWINADENTYMYLPRTYSQLNFETLRYAINFVLVPYVSVYTSDTWPGQVNGINRCVGVSPIFDYYKRCNSTWTDFCTWVRLFIRHIGARCTCAKTKKKQKTPGCRRSLISYAACRPRTDVYTSVCTGHHSSTAAAKHHNICHGSGLSQHIPK